MNVYEFKEIRDQKYAMRKRKLPNQAIDNGENWINEIKKIEHLRTMKRFSKTWQKVAAQFV